MAFTCKKCALKTAKNEQERKAINENWEWHFKSYGPCETCHKTNECIDD